MSAGRAGGGGLSLQVRVAGLSWPFELLGRSVRNTVGFWVVQCEQTGEQERIGCLKH